jgi:hypothetical protein
MNKNDIFYSNNELDVLLYYSKIAICLKNFLKNKKLATKIHLPNLFFIKRGSDIGPLYIQDLKLIDKSMITSRKNHLKDIRNKLTIQQQLVWNYFPPRKLIQLFYATNDEGIGKHIERIFIDIDRRKHTADDSRIVALNLVEIIKSDKDFNKIFKIKKIIVLWTGASFHVYIMLKNSIKFNFYNRYLSYGVGKNESFIMKWAEQLTEKTKILVLAGHEKKEKSIILDSSNTPSGKLARSPFSLHIKDHKTYDGICVPVSFEELKDKTIVKRLHRLTPENVLKDLKKYEKLL